MFVRRRGVTEIFLSLEAVLLIFKLDGIWFWLVGNGYTGKIYQERVEKIPKFQLHANETFVRLTPIIVSLIGGIFWFGWTALFFYQESGELLLSLEIRDRYQINLVEKDTPLFVAALSGTYQLGENANQARPFQTFETINGRFVYYERHKDRSDRLIEDGKNPSKGLDKFSYC